MGKKRSRKKWLLHLLTGVAAMTMAMGLGGSVVSAETVDPDAAVVFEDANLKAALIDYACDLDGDGEITAYELNESVLAHSDLDLHYPGEGCGWDPITDLTGLEAITEEIPNLDLSGNDIESLEPLTNVTINYGVNLSGNSRLSNLDPIVGPEYKNVNLDGTAVLMMEKQKLLYALPEKKEVSGIYKVQLAPNGLLKGSELEYFNVASDCEEAPAKVSTENGCWVEVDLSKLTKDTDITVSGAICAKSYSFAVGGVTIANDEVTLSDDLKAFFDSIADNPYVKVDKNSDGIYTHTEMEQITSLQIFANNIKVNDFTGIEAAVNLRYLIISGNTANGETMPSYKALANIPQLEELTISRSDIAKEDFEYLGKMTQLDYLALDNDNLTDVSGLEALTQLTQLNLKGNQLKNIDGLGMLVNLRELNVDENELTNINPVASMVNMERLFACNNQLTDIPDLSNLTELEFYTYSMEPLSMFNGNKIPRLSLQSKFATEPSEEWIKLNAFVENASPITGIAANVDPDKTDYLVGDTFDPTGLTFLVYHEDGTEEQLDTDYDWDKKDPLTRDDTTVTISYKGFTTQVYIRVTEPGYVDPNMVVPIKDDNLRQALNYYGCDMDNDGFIRVGEMNEALQDCFYLALNVNAGPMGGGGGWGQIKDLSGLEYVTVHFDYCYFGNNDITDLTPLKKIDSEKFYFNGNANLKDLSPFVGKTIDTIGLEGTAVTSEEKSKLLRAFPETLTFSGENEQYVLPFDMMSGEERNAATAESSDPDLICSMESDGYGTLRLVIDATDITKDINATVTVTLLGKKSTIEVHAISMENDTINFPDANLKTTLTFDSNTAPSESDKPMPTYEHADLNSDGKITKTEFAQLEGISMNLVGYPISNFSGMEYATNLEWMIIKDNKKNNNTDGDVDWSALGKISSLKYLTIEDCKLSDLSFVKNLTNLEKLVVINCSVGDASAVSGLVNLKDLVLYNNQIATCPDLTKLTNLVVKDDKNGIRQIFTMNKIPVSGFSADKFAPEVWAQIESIGVDKWLGVNATDTTVVEVPDPILKSHMDINGDGTVIMSEALSLDKLYISHEDVKDLTGLDAATNLTDLTITYTKVTDIAAISKLSNITDLNLTYNDIKQLPDLSTLTNLKVSYRNPVEGKIARIFTGNKNLPATEFEETKFAPKAWTSIDQEWIDKNSYDKTVVKFESDALKDFLCEEYYLQKDDNGELTVGELVWVKDVLIAYKGDVTSLSGLEKAKYLKSLKMFGIDIVDYTPLLEMKSLNLLEIDYSSLDEDALGNIGKLTNLTDLLLIDDKLKDISELAGLTNLTRFVAMRNQITNADVVGKFTKLNTLCLEDNQITNLDVLAKLTNLTRLDLINNKLTSMVSLKDLKKIIPRDGPDYGEEYFFAGNKIPISYFKSDTDDNLLFADEVKAYVEDGDGGSTWEEWLKKNSYEMPTLTMTSNPTKEDYVEGDLFVPAGTEFTVAYPDGTTKVVGADNYTIVDGPVKLHAGTNTIQYLVSIPDELISLPYEYEVEAAVKEIASVTWNDTDVKKSYYVGEDFDTEGLVAHVVYNNDETLDLTGDALEVVDGEALSYGQTSVTVKVKGHDEISGKVISIEVQKNLVTSINVTKQPTKTTYVVGQAFIEDGMELDQVMTDGTTKPLDMNNVILHMPNIEGLGEAVDYPITVQYADPDQEDITFHLTLKVVEKAVVELNATSPADKTEYVVGETYDPTGLILTAEYNDEMSEKGIDKTQFEYDTTPVVMGQTSVAVTYKGMTYQAPITVKKVEVSSLETKVAGDKIYIEGQTFDQNTLTVTAVYNNGDKKEVEDYTITPAGAFHLGDDKITISFTEDDKTVTADVAVTVVAKQITGVKLTGGPTKKDYFAGDKFDPAGSVFTVSYDNGDTALLSDIGGTYSVTNDPLATLQPGMNTIVYKIDVKNPIYTTNVEYQVNATAVQIASIAITTQPTKANYVETQDFDKTGMVVTATNNNGTTFTIPAENLAITDGENLTMGTTSVTVGITASYGFSGTVPCTISVEKKVVTEIIPDTTKINTAYVEGEYFNEEGLATALKQKTNAGTTEDFNGTISYSKDPLETVGDAVPFKVTAAYEGQDPVEFTIQLTVVKLAVTKLEVVTTPENRTFVEGQIFKPAGWTFKATYNANNKEPDVITADQVTCDDTPLSVGQTKVTVSYGGQSVDVAIQVVAKELDRIEVTGDYKTTYIEGQKFDPKGMIVTAYYNDESSKMVENYTIDPERKLTTADTTLTVAYHETTYGDKTLSKAVTIKVTEKQVSSIAVTTNPTKAEYYEGDNFDSTGMVVTATYDNGDEETVAASQLDITGGTDLKLDQTSVTVTYLSKTTTCPITVKELLATEIIVAQQPTKTEYVEGQKFNAAGIKLQEKLNNGTTRDCTGTPAYSTAPLTEISEAYEFGFTVNYTKPNQKALNAKVTLKIKAKEMTKLTVGTMPAKTDYIEGQKFDPTGLTLIAEYNNDTKETVSDVSKITFSNEDLAFGTTDVKVCYGTKDTLVPVKVRLKTPVELSASVTGTNNYIEGQIFDKSQIVVTVSYDNDTKRTLDNEEYTVDPAGKLAMGMTKVAIGYTENSKLVEASVNIKVREKSVTAIAITHDPYKTLGYIEGGDFDPTGMVVEATYDNGETEEVTGYTCVPSAGLSAVDEAVIVQYKGKTDKVDIWVDPLCVTSLNIKRDPNYTAYLEGTEYNNKGIVIEAEYNDGTTRELSKTDWNYELTEAAATSEDDIPNARSSGYNWKQAVYEFGDQTIGYPVAEIGADTTPEKVEIKQTAEQLHYEETAEEFDPTGMKVEADFGRGLIVPLPVEKVEVSNIQWTKDETTQEVTGGTVEVAFNGVAKEQPVQAGVHEHNWEVDDSMAATCSEDGYVHSICTVENCGQEKQDDTEAYGHSWSDTTENPTCTEGGYTLHVCDNCGAELKDTYTQAEGHSYVDTEHEATCTEDGCTEHICSVCGDTYKDAFVSSEGHDYEAVVTKPTCTAQGYTTYTCTICGDQYVDDYVDALGHDWDKGVVHKATCTEAGYTVFTCSRCHTTEQRNPVAATGHSFGGWIVSKQPTTGAEGSQYRECSKCHVRETKSIAKKQTGKWKHNSKGWWYEEADGSYYKNTFLTISGEVYYFNGSGYMVTGWSKVSGKWYYFESSGAMKTGWLKSGSSWYYMNSNGAMATGMQKVGNTTYFFNGSGVMLANKWAQSGGKWYYFTGSGAMKTGWLKLGNTWYYMSGSGIMQTGLVKVGNTMYYFAGSGAMAANKWVSVSGKWYYFTGSGAMKTGWQKLGSTWYYMQGNGAMVTGLVKVGNATYYFNGSGAMKTGWQKLSGKWYYFNTSGSMKTGWLKLGSTWYYMYDTGIMAANTWVGNDYVNGSGVWTKSR